MCHLLFPLKKLKSQAYCHMNLIPAFKKQTQGGSLWTRGPARLHKSQASQGYIDVVLITTKDQDFKIFVVFPPPPSSGLLKKFWRARITLLRVSHRLAPLISATPLSGVWLPRIISPLLPPSTSTKSLPVTKIPTLLHWTVRKEFLNLHL